MSGKVLGGDFKDGVIELTRKQEPFISWGGSFSKKKLFLKDQIAGIEIITEENKKSFTGAAGWGFVGAAALGPLGLIAGALAGGNSNKICFACTLNDGRRFLAVSDSDMYHRILSLTFSPTQPPSVQPDSLPSQPQPTKSNAFYKKSWFMWATLIILFPLFPIGLFFLWKHSSYSRNSKIAITLCVLGLAAVILTSKPKTPSTVSTPAVIDLRSAQNMPEIKHGTTVIVSGVVQLGNGKLASRSMVTSFGDFKAQPFTLIDEKKNEWRIVLATPSPESLYEKKISVKGIIDQKSTDPGVKIDSAIPVVKSEIIN